jgi:hypothetical protein
MKIRKWIIILIVLVLIFFEVGKMNIGGDSIFSSNSGTFVLPGTLTRDFSFFDYARYFDNWPIIVCLSFFIAFSSSVALVCVVINICIRSYKQAQWDRHVAYFIGCPVRCSEKQRLKSPVELLI